MNSARLDRRLFLGLIGGSLTKRLPGAAKSESASPIVQITAGKIRGSVQDRVNAFKGIPYGASTGDAGRFMPPAKPQAWTGVRDALELGPASPQIPSRLVPESMAQQPATDASGTED